MDNIIFEDPSKQRPRLKRASQVQPVEFMPNQNGPTYGEQQIGLPSPGLGAGVVSVGGLGGLSGSCTPYVDGDKSCQTFNAPDGSDFDPASATTSSVGELSSMTDDDRYSIDDASLDQRDSLFSSPEPEESTDEKRAGSLPVDFLDSGDGGGQVQVHGQGQSRPSLAHKVNCDVERRTEHDHNERTDNLQGVTTALDDRQLDGHNQAESRAGSVALSDNSYRPGAVGVVGVIEQATFHDTLDDSRTSARHTVHPHPTFPLSRKRGGVVLPDLSLRGADVHDDHTPCRKKLSPSRLCQNRRATQKRPPQRSPSNFPLSAVRSRPMSCDFPIGSDRGQHNAENEVVWEYRHLLDYRTDNGKSLVLVPWVPTWEPADEYPPEEVERVRRQSLGQMHARRRGRPRSKQYQ